MADFIKQIASPAVLNHAWSLVRNDRARWTRDLTMQEVERNLPLHVGRISEDLINDRYRPQDVYVFQVQKANGGQRPIPGAPSRAKDPRRLPSRLHRPTSVRQPWRWPVPDRPDPRDG